jgi:hypothetical protein
MKLVNFFLALIAGFSIVKLFRFYAEVELNEEEEYDIYDDELEYPLFV